MYRLQKLTREADILKARLTHYSKPMELSPPSPKPMCLFSSYLRSKLPFGTPSGHLISKLQQSVPTRMYCNRVSANKCSVVRFCHGTGYIFSSDFENSQNSVIFSERTEVNLINTLHRYVEVLRSILPVLVFGEAVAYIQGSSLRVPCSFHPCRNTRPAGLPTSSGPRCCPLTGWGRLSAGRRRRSSVPLRGDSRIRPLWRLSS